MKLNPIFARFCMGSAVISGFSWIGAAQATAATFVTGLDGVATSSTFESNSGGATPLPSLGWKAVSGSAQVFDQGPSNNGGLMGGTPYGNFGVEFDTSTAILPNSLYTLSLDMGYFAGLTGGNSGYSFQLGTVNGGLFTGLGTTQTGTAPYAGILGAGNYSKSDSLTFTSGATVSGDNLAVRWSQTSSLGQNDGGTSSDFFAVDNVKLSVAAVPEPGTNLLMVSGVLALLGVGRRRRSTPN